MPQFWTARVPAARGEIDALMTAWEEAEPAPLAVSAIERAENAWVVEALYPEAPDVAALEALLGKPVSLDGLADQNWVARSLEGLPPVEAGRLVVAGAHAAAAVPANKRLLVIEASLAFGSGHHATTLTCLLALDHLRKTMRRPRRALDVGTGSGVLALGAAALWRAPVVATDIDEVAVAAATANARANGLSRDVAAVTAIGVAHPSVRARAPYDLVMANILAGPLTALAPALTACLAPGGALILSGILSTQARGVFARYRAQGLILRRRFIRGEWTTLLLTRPADRLAP
ncbi:MAG: methyltransferase [Alphaproteobacteria bacterium]|nr:methyltransferase [Alphaproteobacteria bacterium]